MGACLLEQDLSIIEAGVFEDDLEQVSHGFAHEGAWGKPELRDELASLEGEVSNGERVAVGANLLHALTKLLDEGELPEQPLGVALGDDVCCSQGKLRVDELGADPADPTSDSGI